MMTTEILYEAATSAFSEFNTKSNAFAYFRQLDFNAQKVNVILTITEFYVKMFRSNAKERLCYENYQKS